MMKKKPRKMNKMMKKMLRNMNPLDKNRKRKKRTRRSQRMTFLRKREKIAISTPQRPRLRLLPLQLVNSTHLLKMEIHLSKCQMTMMPTLRLRSSPCVQ
jgi:hypothetical protein